MTDLELRDQGYHDANRGDPAMEPDSEAYMDGYRLGELVRMADKERGLIGDGNPS